MNYLSPFPQLPGYTGNFSVGSCEYEIPLKNLSISTPNPDKSITTIKFRAFYPTHASTPALPTYWLPEPQTRYLQGYLKLARLRPWAESLMLKIPFYLRTTTIPASTDAPLLLGSVPYPVLVFSHGLVGNMNTHSALLGELASRGIVCVAPEHRDGSSSISFTRSENMDNTIDEMSSIHFKRIPFLPKNLEHRERAIEYQNRDHQLKIRLFELSATYEVLMRLNQGQRLPNLASGPDASGTIFPKGSLELSAGSVTWAGHSFGGATMVQFMKSVYYSSRSPEARTLLAEPPRDLIAQILPSSPLALLDPWAMPLRSSATAWLHAHPLPVHFTAEARLPGYASARQSPSTIAIATFESMNYWPEIHSHTRKLLAPDPSAVRVQTPAEYDAELAKYGCQAEFIRRKKLEVRERERLRKSQAPNTAPKAPEKPKYADDDLVAMFMLHDSAHITLSDFGLLFPWVTWWFTGQKQPERALRATVELVMGIVRQRTGARVDVADARQAAELEGCERLSVDPSAAMEETI